MVMDNVYESRGGVSVFFFFPFTSNWGVCVYQWHTRVATIRSCFATLYM